MRRGQRFPNDQAEVVFFDSFIEQLADLTTSEQIDVTAEVVRLCSEPSGKHPLRWPLVGWNTLDVLQGHRRVVYRASLVDNCGVIEVLCIGRRSDNEVYDVAHALLDAGLLTPEEATALWDALAILEIVEEDVGLDGWDFAPPPAPTGMVRAAVAAGLLEEQIAMVLSQPELEAAMEHGWSADGPDPQAALLAALERARMRARRRVDPQSVFISRIDPRCLAPMPRAGARCIRRRDHPGPHRAR